MGVGVTFPTFSLYKTYRIQGEYPKVIEKENKFKTNQKAEQTELGLGHRRSNWSFAINLGCRNGPWLESLMSKQSWSEKGLKKTKKQSGQQHPSPQNDFF